MTTPAPVPHFTPIADTRPNDRPWPTMHWPPHPKLTGSFVELTPFDPDDDAEALYTVLDHDQVWEHLTHRPADPAGYRAMVAGQRERGWHTWTVRLTQDWAGFAAGAAVGASSYLEVSVGDARLEVGGTTYAPGVWSGPVNPDTKLQLLGHAFDVLGTGRVQLRTDVRNTRSQQAIARLGAQYEGSLRRYQRRRDDTVRDTVVFSVLAEEWPDVRARLWSRVRGFSAARAEQS